MDNPLLKADDIHFIEKKLAGSPSFRSIIYDLNEFGAISHDVFEFCMNAETTQTNKARKVVSCLSRLQRSHSDLPLIEKIAQVFLNNDLQNVAQVIHAEFTDTFSTNNHTARDPNFQHKEEIYTLPHIHSSASLPSLSVVPHSPTLPEASTSYHENLNEARPEINVTPSRFIYGGERHDDVYKNESRPRGYTLIVNVEKFESDIHKQRTGSTVDVENLDSLFSQMGYTTEQYHNPTREQLYKTLNEFRDKEELKNVDSCVVVVMSHGIDDKNVITADNRHVHIYNILERFNNGNCPNLIGKPKIFIFQFCRGSLPDLGVDIPINNVANDNSYFSVDGGNQGITGPLSRLPTYSDMIVIYPTVEGYVAYLNQFRGSWLIEAICLEFMEHAHNTNILELLHKVSRRVKAQYSERGRKQAPVWEVKGFDKHFYFNPPLWDLSSLNLDDLSNALPFVDIGITTATPPHRRRHLHLENLSRSSTPEPILTNFDLQQSGSASWIRRRHWSGASTGSREYDGTPTTTPRQTGAGEGTETGVVRRFSFGLAAESSSNENGDYFEDIDVVDTLQNGHHFTRIQGTKEDFQNWRRSYESSDADEKPQSLLKRQLSAPTDTEAMSKLNSLKNYLQVNDLDHYAKTLDPIQDVILKNKNKFKKTKREINSLDF